MYKCMLDSHFPANIRQLIHAYSHMHPYVSSNLMYAHMRIQYVLCRSTYLHETLAMFEENRSFSAKTFFFKDHFRSCEISLIFFFRLSKCKNGLKFDANRFVRTKVKEIQSLIWVIRVGRLLTYVLSRDIL